eukprot:9503911-Pyramimonas_sp.AAC.2
MIRRRSSLRLTKNNPRSPPCPRFQVSIPRRQASLRNVAYSRTLCCSTGSTHAPRGQASARGLRAA